MAPPSTHIDSAELQGNSGGFIVNSMQASTACSRSMQGTAAHPSRLLWSGWSPPPGRAQRWPQRDRSLGTAKGHISPGRHWREKVFPPGRKKPPLLSLLLCGDLGQLRFQQGPQGRVLITNVGKCIHLCGGYASSQALWLFPFTSRSDLELIWFELWTACTHPGLGHASLLLSALVYGWRKKRPITGCASTSVITPH